MDPIATTTNASRTRHPDELEDAGRGLAVAVGERGGKEGEKEGGWGRWSGE
jgi:hypothetical protein